jgi:hypothetical protein
MADLETFMNRLNAVSSNYIGRLASDVAVQAALVVMADLSERTPADVGTALSNWQVTLDTPASEIIPAYAPSPKGKVIKRVWTHAVDPLATIAANAPSVMDNARSVLSHKQPGQPIFITNNMPYIQLLNSGSSEQAPAGFVDRAELLAAEVVRNVSVG